jgi:DNA adenine methylase
MPQPFLKWAGGKTQLLDQILPQLPERISTYYEPFIGGGAVFFALATEGRFERAVIADQNPMLIDVYSAIRDDVDGVIDHLESHADHATDPDYYYEVRAQDPEALHSTGRAARIIFLNKTCYNGLYRVNRSGKFNVPFGRYTNPRVLNEAVLLAASRALRRVEIVHSDFEAVAHRAKKGDAVYFDPPYHPVSATASFNAYDKTAFGEKEQRRLAKTYRALVEEDISSVLSNSDCPLTRALYSGLDVHTVLATRAINSAAEKRGRVTEILVVGSARARSGSRSRMAS